MDCDGDLCARAPRRGGAARARWGPLTIVSPALDPRSRTARPSRAARVVALPSSLAPRAAACVLFATAPTRRKWSPHDPHDRSSNDSARTQWPCGRRLRAAHCRPARRTPEEWIDGERSLRVQGVIRLLRAVGLDPAKGFRRSLQIVTGRALRARCRSRTRSRPVAVEGPRCAHPARGKRGSHASAPSPSCSRWGSASRASGDARRVPEGDPRARASPPPDGCDAKARRSAIRARRGAAARRHWSQPTGAVTARRRRRLRRVLPSPLRAARPSALVHACVPPTACSPGGVDEALQRPAPRARGLPPRASARSRAQGDAVG